MSQVEITNLSTLPQFTIILHSTGKNNRKWWGKEWEYDAITNSVFLVFDTGMNSLEEQLCFVLTLLLEKNTSDILLVFPTIVMITPQVREPSWRFYNSLRLSMPILSRTGVLSTGGAWVPPWVGSEAHTSSISNKPPLWQVGVAFHQAIVSIRASVRESLTSLDSSHPPGQLLGEWLQGRPQVGS